MFTLQLILLTMIVSLILTPLVIVLSIKIGAVDMPNVRKVHTKPVSVLGGSVILISFLIGLWWGKPVEHETVPIILGAIVIYIIGLVDDLYDMKPLVKLAGQIAVSLIVVFNHVTLDFITLPFGVVIEFGIFSIPMTIFWVVAVMNAINLIDGLDGLASGISCIALVTIGFIAILQQNIFIMMICSVLIGSLLGFLVFNSHPAKIFLGDSGALLLGYIIGVLSLLGFKNITLISLFFPMVILAVPFIDMLFAVIRRLHNRQSIVQADKSHLHHRLLDLGYTHRQTVILIYMIAILFSISSVILYLSPPYGVLMMFIMILITIELIVEFTGLVNANYRPILNLLTRTKYKKER